MDAFLFIGYRIDCRNDDVDIWDMENNIPDCYPRGGFACNKYDWGYWPSAVDGVDSYLRCTDQLFYECPMGHHVLWSELQNKTFDLPDNHQQIVEEIENSQIYAKLKELYGNVEIKFGIFKGVS